MTISLEAWLDAINHDYLDGYVPSGGSAIKFAVTDRTDANLVDELLDYARERRFVTAVVDGAATRVGRIDQVFCAIALQVPWRDLAAPVRANAISAHGWQSPDSRPVTFDSLAEANGQMSVSVENRIQQWLTASVFLDYRMSTEFRMAMMTLILDPMGTSVGETALHSSILDWLTGQPLMLSALRPAQIYQRIARHNARDLLVSLGRWVQCAGRPGLHVVIDARTISLGRRTTGSLGSFYGRPQLIDMYEVFRQFIDAMDELQHTLITVILPAAFLSDDVRGLRAYPALEMRIAEEVRDRVHSNPLAAMVQLSEVAP